MAILALINPEGSMQRWKRLKRWIYRSKVAHNVILLLHSTLDKVCDEYEKLKRFGIAIHGCMDAWVLTGIVRQRYGRLIFLTTSLKHHLNF